MKALALLAILVVMLGCSSAPEQPTAAPTPAAGATTDALSMDNTTTATSTKNAPVQEPGASFKIEPADKSKFPSNAVGGG